MIKEFEEIYTQGYIPSGYGLLENIEKGISKNDGEANLTRLQKTVLGDEHFWCKENFQSNNLIIQGATSAGKTLLAELLALHLLWKKNKHIVYLVPLKALVSEKRKQFENDMGGGQRVYGSSSDYQDHDTELMEGNYDVAVVVYEKFFAMLADLDTNKFLRDCGLIVVDEIQLLSSQERGAKLEYGLTKVIRNFGKQIRILGLTTVDCDVTNVKKWLEADIIKETSRPVPLRERVIDLTGKYWERLVLNDSEIGKESPVCDTEHIEGNIYVPTVSNKLRSDQKKVELLRALLKYLYKQNSNTKVIVFVSRRKKCSWLAKEICNGDVLPRQNYKFSIAIQELKKMDFYDKKDSNDWEEHLLPSGIAYHSAELAMSMRELIEGEFRKNDGMIRLIVATETLMIGMNLPADVMILFDDEVFRLSEDDNAEPKSFPLSPQEYKNYIGRAGRLGISNRHGESYFLVMDNKQIGVKWNRYVNAKIESVSSALINADEIKMGPYFLNLLCNKSGDTFSVNNVEESYHKTLKFAETKRTDGCEKILNNLEKAKLIQKELNVTNFMDFFNENRTYNLEKYIPTQFGRAMAPYALSLESCLKVYYCFVQDGYYENNKKIPGMPLDYEGVDLVQGKYLLDILYTICEIKEVRKLKYPSLPNALREHRSQETFMALIKIIRDFLVDYRSKHGEESAFWKNSYLENICNNVYTANNEDIMNYALRAILLFLWLQGNLMEDIRKKIGLAPEIRFSISSGDLSRLGEVSSYVIEAIANSLYTNAARMDANGGKIGPLTHAFRMLSSQIKYGMKDPDLLLIAKTNIPGISRKTIINLGNLAKLEKYESLSLMINSGDKKLKDYLSAEQIRELKKRLNTFNRTLKKDIERLYESGRLPVEQEKYREYLEQLAYPDNEEVWKKSLTSILRRICHPVEEWNDASDKLIGCNLEQENGKTIHIIFYVFKEGDRILTDSSHANEYLKELKLETNSDVLFIIDKKEHLDTSVSELEDEDKYIIGDYKKKFMSSIDFCRYAVEIIDKVGDGLTVTEKSNTANYIMGEILEKNYKWKGKRACRELVQRLVKQYKDGGNGIDKDIDSFMKNKGFKRVRNIENNIYVYQKIADESMQRAVKILIIPDDVNGYPNSENINEIPPDSDGIKTQADILYKALKEDDVTDIIEKALKEADFDILSKSDNEKLHRAIFDCFKDKLHSSLSDKVLAGIIKNTVKDIKKYADDINSGKDFATAMICYFLGERAYYEARYQEENSNFSNIVHLHDVDKRFLWNDDEEVQASVQIIITMDLMEGSLKQEIGNLSVRDTITLGIQMCNALQRCHDLNIVHRDIKPANILYRKTVHDKKEYYLSDFGIAATVGEIKSNTMGTLAYMAPDEKYSPQSDIYSLGKTLLKLCKNVQENYELINILKKASSENISERYSSMKEFAAALKKVNNADNS